MAAAELGAQGAALLFFARLNLLFLVKIGLYILNGTSIFIALCYILIAQKRNTLLYSTVFILRL